MCDPHPVQDTVALILESSCMYVGIFKVAFLLLLSHLITL